MPPESIIALITDLGAFGFILYLVHRTQTYTIPRLAASFEKAIVQQREDFKETITQQREDFGRMMEREQAAHELHTDRLVKSLESLEELGRSLYL